MLLAVLNTLIDILTLLLSKNQGDFTGYLVLWLAQSYYNLGSLALSSGFRGGPLCSDQEHLTDLNDQLVSTLKLMGIEV
jgi:hypothetical protein